MHRWFVVAVLEKTGGGVELLWRGCWPIDGGAGAAARIQRAFVSQPSACFGSLIEVGICGLHTMAWELTSGGGGIATPASSFHRERGVALNRRAYSRLEG